LFLSFHHASVLDIRINSNDIEKQELAVAG